MEPRIKQKRPTSHYKVGAAANPILSAKLAAGVFYYLPCEGHPADYPGRKIEVGDGPVRAHIVLDEVNSGNAAARVMFGSE